MIKKFILIVFVFGYIFFGINHSKEITLDPFSKFINIQGDYLGQSPPGITPELFTPFLLDYKKHHIHSSPVFSPKGDEVYFSLYVDDLDPQKMFYSKMDKDGIWSKPVLVPFSGKFHEGHPLFSPDGKRLYFYSKHPLKNGVKIRKVFNIWFVEKQNGNWSKPNHLNTSFQTELLSYPSHFGADGSLFFKVNIEKEGFRLFKGNVIGKKIFSVKKMEKPVTLDPKEEYLIFNVLDKETKKLRFDIAFKKKDGTWTEPIPMGDTVNNKQFSSRFPGFSHDGKYFFFTSTRSGYERIYWVSRELFEIYHKSHLKFMKKQ